MKNNFEQTTLELDVIDMLKGLEYCYNDNLSLHDQYDFVVLGKSVDFNSSISGYAKTVSKEYGYIEENKMPAQIYDTIDWVKVGYWLLQDYEECYSGKIGTVYIKEL